jgi:hypothetical protein
MRLIGDPQQGRVNDNMLQRRQTVSQNHGERSAGHGSVVD